MKTHIPCGLSWLCNAVLNLRIISFNSYSVSRHSTFLFATGLRIRSVDDAARPYDYFIFLVLKEETILELIANSIGALKMGPSI